MGVKNKEFDLDARWTLVFNTGPQHLSLEVGDRAENSDLINNVLSQKPKKETVPMHHSAPRTTMMITGHTVEMGKDPMKFRGKMT